MATILIAGGSGLVGSRLSQLLQQTGHRVLHLSRSPDPHAAFPTYAWDVAKGTIDLDAVTQADYLVNLAGAGIADASWTPARKALIISSRTQSARLLAQACLTTGHRPRAYVAASAIGYYGSRGDTLLTEEDGPGQGFLSESCVAWENATAEVPAQLGVRTAVIRIGVVLSSQGGALAKMLPPAQLMVSPYFGDGRQWYSWIHIDDLCHLMAYAFEHDQMAGTYNGVAPHPVRNRELAQALPRALGKPAFSPPAPAFALRLALGEMSAVVLDSTRCSADKILASGFTFQYPDLLPALEDVLAREV